MDPGTIIGLLLGIIAVFAALFMEGGNPAAFLIPSPIVLVIFGTLGVCMASTGLKATLRIPKLWIKAMTGTPPDRPEAIKTLVRMAERARREGLLALEEEAQGVDDPFLSKGLRLVVDGTDPELVKDILDLDVESMAGRHHENAALFTHASRLRADDRHHRHGDGAGARPREPLEPGGPRARPSPPPSSPPSSASPPPTSATCPWRTS